MKALLALALVAAGVAPNDVGRVAITVRPTVLFAGDSVWMRCWVPSDPENRYLQWGIADYRESTVELDGDKAARNYEWLIERVPCDAGRPFCRVIRAKGRDVLVTATLEVSCRQ